MSSPAEPERSGRESDASHGEASVVRSLTRAAAALALLVAIGGPASYLSLMWGAARQDITLSSRLYAAFVMQALSRASDDWRRDVEGLLDATLVDQALPERRAIVDLENREVTSNQAMPEWPRLTHVVPLGTRDGPVGRLELSRSMAPIVRRTGVVALASVALGLAIFATLRILPVRALHRVLDVLARAQQRRRQELEQYVHVLFERAVEGIIVFTRDGHVVSCNPRAAEMLGTDPGAVVGADLARFIDPPGGAFAVGQAQTIARRGGLIFPCELTVSLLPVSDGTEHFVGNVRDLTERRQAELRQRRLANYDSLTGLPNRSLFRERLGEAMARARSSGRQMALMFLDLDRFKMINDSLGHDAGDRLLKHVATVLTTSVRQSDVISHWSGAQHDGFTVSRLGGDEFTVIIEDLRDANQASGVATRMMQALEQPFYVDGHEIVVTTSLGLTMYPADDASLDELLRHADMAMYRAKEAGRNGVRFYSDELNAAAARRLHLETHLRHALDRGEFSLHYQPKLDVRTRQVTGVEALLRWQAIGELPVPPDQFIRVLEETGLVLPVGQWVLEQATRQVSAWHAAGLSSLRLAVNLSVRQLRQPDLASMVARVLTESGFAPAALELELTESMLMDGDDLQNTLKALSDFGVNLAIDDFGTGYSSLAYLKRFYVDTLKIDRRFVMDTPHDPESTAIVSAVIALARSLNMRVVAEGVETGAQVALLEQLGCDELQGFWLSKPLPASAFEAWLVERRAVEPELACQNRRDPA